MTAPKEPDAVKLIVSVFTADARLFPGVLKRLEECFGAIDVLSGPFALDTDYYSGEIGSPLTRKVLSFSRQVSPGDLSSIKLLTNAMEGEFAEAGARKVNIDPGYIALEKLVLASCKNFSHRVYVGGGVYAEVTLMYERGKGFKTLEWTYPDYGTEEMRSLLVEIRKRLLAARPTGAGS